ncbi:MAG: ATP-dependent helicase [Bacteroidia bacterium]
MNELDPFQQAAVEHSEGAALVLAGAGSGKTRTLTHRIAYLIQTKKVKPHRILALTFTNKAADTMRQRLHELVGPQADTIYMGTFHSQFSKFLRPYAHLLGYTASYSIYDEDDAKSLLTRVVKHLSLNPKEVSTYRRHISLAKNHLQLPPQDPKTPWERVYALYQKNLLEANAMDFDDLLVQTYLLLQNHPQPRTTLQQTWDHILVDEYQDTNLAQYQIIKILAQPHQNLFVVGDDAQSIYAFRGATLDNFKHIQKDFPTLKIYKLEKNYRSTQAILEAANRIIEHNNQPYPKTLFTEMPTVEKPKLLVFSSRKDEAENIVRNLRELRMRYGLKYKQIAILYRGNSSSRNFEEALRTHRIPYRLLGGISFYRREEVKNLLYHLRLIMNPQDTEALVRVATVPPKGIGPRTLEQLEDYALKNHVSLWQAFLEAPFKLSLSSSVGKALNSFTSQVQKWRQLKENYALSEFLHLVSQESNLLTYYQEEEERLQNLTSLIYDDALNTLTLEDWLAQVALYSTTDVQENPEEDFVWLSTVHSVKGMEFDAVFVVDMVEGYFPTSRAEEIEEERRIFYVALTRAKQFLYVSYSHEGRQPSRFLQEAGLLPSRKRYEPTPPLAPTPDIYLKEALDPQAISIGMRICHSTFGSGTVLNVEGNAPPIATVAFDKYGTKKLDLRFAKLRPE